MSGKRHFWLLSAPALMLLLTPAAWSAWQSWSSHWGSLTSNKLASIETEQALYETPGSNHFYLYFRITNRVQKPIAVDLNENTSPLRMFYPYRWTLAEGDHLVVSEMLPVYLTSDLQQKESKLRADFKAGKLTTISPAGTLDFYSESQTGGHAEISTSWESAPLWMKSKSFIPRTPRPIHFFASIRGLISFTDGINVANCETSKANIAIRFPLHWKQLPRGATVTR